MFDAYVAETGAQHASLGVEAAPRQSTVKVDLSSRLDIRVLEADELIVVSKRTDGFDETQIDVLRRLLRDVASGQVGPCKFIVFDFAASGGASAKPAPQFEALVEELSNLIFQVPVLSIAWVRRRLSGPELELALACSMMAGEEGSLYAFDIDVVDSLRTYALLAHKLGFVRAERLMENGSVLDAATAHDLMLLHSVLPAREGLDGIRGFVRARARRHNSSCGLYRAQRIAMTGAH